MGRYIKQDNEIQSENVSTTSEYHRMAAEVSKKVDIPMYFYKIIVPQMGSYYDEYPVNFDAKIVVCCPLHDEDTPSFRYYENTSSFYCFGCQRGGDVVELHRDFAEKINGTKPSRAEAVYFLYATFVDGQDVAIKEKSGKIVTKKQSEDKDVVEFNIYRINIENSITADETIEFEKKKQVWELLDKVDILLSLDKIDYSNAKKELKQDIEKIIFSK